MCCSCSRGIWSRGKWRRRRSQTRTSWTWRPQRFSVRNKVLAEFLLLCSLVSCLYLEFEQFRWDFSLFNWLNIHVYGKNVEHLAHQIMFHMYTDIQFWLIECYFFVDREICSTDSGSEHDHRRTLGPRGICHNHNQNKTKGAAVPEVPQTSSHPLPRTRPLSEQHHEPFLKHIYRGSHRPTRGTAIPAEPTSRSLWDGATLHSPVLCAPSQCPPTVCGPAISTSTRCTSKCRVEVYYSLSRRVYLFKHLCWLIKHGIVWTNLLEALQ